VRRPEWSENEACDLWGSHQSTWAEAKATPRAEALQLGHLTWHNAATADSYFGIIVTDA